MKRSIPAMDRPMVRITALLCMLLFSGFVLADYALATVKPPVHVKMGTDFVAKKGGPHIHVAKKGEVTNIKIEISSGVDMDNADFELILSEGWEFIGGQKNWHGKLQKDGTIIIKATVRATGDNFGVIKGKIHLPEACTDIEGMLDLRDPETTDRVPEWGETTDLPEDAVPEIEQAPAPSQVLPESSVAPAEPGEPGLEGSCTVRAKGRLVYQDDTGAYIGISGARVILWDDDLITDEECGRGITDANGNYDITGTCGDLFDNPDIFIQVYAINTNYVQVEPDGILASPYTAVTPTINNICGTYDYASKQVPASQAGAYQLFNQAVQANQYIDIYDTAPPFVKVNWPTGGLAASYNGEINIRNADTWDEPTMYHEYGHLILHTYAVSPSPNYCNGICDQSATNCGHCIWSPENGFIHWTDGWPYFFADVLCDFYHRNNRVGFEFHTHAGYTNTDMIEGFTAAILWDIFDSTQDNHDNDGSSDQLSLGFDEIWNVTTHYDPGGTYNFPLTIHQFWDGFYALYPGYRLGLWNVYAENHITKPCPITPGMPNLVSPADGATGVSLTPLLNWDDVSGATSYDVQVSTNNTFTAIVRTATVTSSQWTVSPTLTAETIYYWRVQGKNACATGPWSGSNRSFKTLCTLPVAPTLISPANGATNASLTPLLDWNDVAGAISYEVQVSLYSTFTVVLRSATVTGSQWIVSPALNAGTTYYWRVRTKNACGYGPWTGYRSFRTLCVTPVAPTLISPANGATNVSLTPLLDWGDVAYATSYEVQVSLTNTFASLVRSGMATSSAWSVSPALNVTTTYYWRVRAINACATGAWSSIRSFRTLCVTPLSPTLVSPANGATSISLTPLLDWGDVANATSYEVQVSLTNTFASVARSATVKTSQWIVSPALNANTLYYWRVRAKNACATGPWSTVRSFRTGLCPSTVAPTLVSPANGATNVSRTPLLDWNAVTNAASYEVQVSTNSTFTSVVRSATVTLSQWTVSTALNLNTTYYWRVRAKNGCGTAGPWSSIRSFTTILL